MTRKKILGAVSVSPVSPMDGLWLELEKRHDMLLWGKGRPGYVRRRQMETFGKVDLVLLSDLWRGDSERWEVTGLTSPLVCVFTDTDRKFDIRVEWLKRHKPKLLVLRVKDDVPRFRAALPDQRVEWLPFGFDPAVFHDYGEDKEYDVAMFGVRNKERYPVRWKAREVLLASDIDFRDFTSETRDWPTGVTYAKRLARAKIAIVTGGKPGFVVQKYYETPACGTAMLTPEIGNGLSELFRPGIDYVTFNTDCSDLIEKIRFLTQGLRWKCQTLFSGTIVHKHTNASRADELERMLGWRD